MFRKLFEKAINEGMKTLAIKPHGGVWDRSSQTEIEKVFGKDYFRTGFNTNSLITFEMYPEEVASFKKKFKSIPGDKFKKAKITNYKG